MECLRDAREARESGWERHSIDNTDHCETTAARQVSTDRRWWQRPRARPRAACECRPAARTPAPEARATIWAGVRGEYRLLHPKTECPCPPIRSGRFFD